MKERQDRIADLEGTVRELEATVLGVTEELVEANERIRHLEAALGTDAASGRRPGRERAAGDGSYETDGTGDSADDTVPDEPLVVGDDLSETGVESDDAAAGTADSAAGAGEEAQKAIGDESDSRTDTRETDDDIIIA